MFWGYVIILHTLPRNNVIKLFTAVSYVFFNMQERLSQPSPMFPGKAGAYSSETPERGFTLG